MRTRNKFLSTALTLIIAGIPLSSHMAALPHLSDSSVTVMNEPPISQEDTLSLFAKGPGIVNLSLGDEFATYQWGLQNYGEFQLIEMTDKFRSIDLSLQDTSSQAGPGAYKSIITNATEGIDINIRPAWDLYDASTNQRSVTIALIDTGVDYSHPELQEAIWTNPGEVPNDGIDNDGNGYIDDIHGWNFHSNSSQLYLDSEDNHGTHSAGTISANRNSNGIVGIADNRYVKIMPLKALSGVQGTGSVQAVVNAIKYAEANGASICNLSLGTTTYSQELAQTIQNSGMLFIIAAGNGNTQGVGYDIDQSPVYPASFPFDNIISVGNLLFDGNLSNSSNYGVTSVDIAAPGSYILSTIPGNDYAYMSGTSMAAPMVTGVASMLYSYRPELSLSEVRQILLNSSKKLAGLNGKVSTGGMLDAYAAFTYQIESAPVN